MAKRVTLLALSWGLTFFLSGCATKGFVREQVSSAEGRAGQKIAGQNAKLRESSAQLDSKIGELRSMANEAST